MAKAQVMDEAQQSDTFIEVDLSNTNTISLPEVGEQLVRCKTMKPITGDAGKVRLFMVLEVVGQEYWSDIFHTLWLPYKDDEPKQQAEATTKILEACEAFGIGHVPGGFDPNMFLGNETYAIIGHRENKQLGRTEGYIQRWSAGSDPSDEV